MEERRQRGRKTRAGTDPFDADSDDDGLTDGAEVNAHGTDPLDPGDPPAIPLGGPWALGALAALLVAAGRHGRARSR